MVSFSFSLLALLSTLGGLTSVVGSPTHWITSNITMFNHPGVNPTVTDAHNNSESAVLDHPALDNTARNILARATPAAPHFVIYGDKFVPGDTGPPKASALKGYNVFVLSFLLTSGPADKAAEWASLSDSQRTTVKNQYASAGIKLIASAFGATDKPTSSDPVRTANTMANWIKKFKLDGIDVDYEDLDAVNAGNGKAEAWLTTFTRQLRQQLPQGQFILTHAPLAPWFSPGKFGGGAYLTVNKNVGGLIDWYNVQFYNQGANEYTSCSGLFTKSSSVWPKTAVFEIAASGIPLRKVVVGKPGTAGDASNGFINPTTLSGCLPAAKGKGWNAGVMVWEYPDANAKWIQTVRSKAWPV